MASDRQIEANQANALKSTGPKTAQGKATARRNALKHGMTCNRESLFATDEKLYKKRLESWTKSAKPRNDMELYQIESAVRAAVNLDRCARNEEAEMHRRQRKAEGHWDGEQTKKLNRATEFWATEPAACVATLETFTRGCAWMLERWEELSQALQANECWTVSQTCFAIRLMGKAPEVYLDSDDEGNAFRALAVAASPDLDAEVVDCLLGLDGTKLEPEEGVALLAGKLPSREDALEGLWATIDAEIERLDTLRSNLWEHADGPALATRIDLASFDGSKKGVLRRRYQSANHLDVHRCLKEFSEQRKQTEIRVEEDRLSEKQARAARANELYKQTAPASGSSRNEANASEIRDLLASTSGKSAADDPRPAPTLMSYARRARAAQEAASETARPSNPAAPGTDESQKTS